MQNVDAQELAKFSDLAHRWWDRNSEFRPLHEINPLRLDWIDELARLRASGARRRLRRRHPGRSHGRVGHA
jgi:2-polyprenyl-3-methyl-5-hydroxy-6-metoxy-1,4-benzoquinol methylase